jgi:hypothetical protein
LALPECGIGTEPTPIDRQVDAFFPAERAEPLRECGDNVPAEGVASGTNAQEAEAPHPTLLLRVYCERPSGGSATEKLDENTPSHCFPQGSSQGIVLAGSTTR